MKFPDIERKSLIALPASRNESWSGGRDPSDSPRKSILLSPWIGRCRTEVDVLRSWSPPRVWFVHLRLEKYILFFFREHILFRIESFWVDFWCVHRLQLLKICNQYFTLSNSSPHNAYPRNNPDKTFFSKLMDSWLVLRSYKMIPNQWTKWNNRSVKWLPKRLS